MRFIKALPRYRGTAPRRLAHPGGTGRQARLPAIVPAAFAAAGHGTLLAAVSIAHVISNTTAWITGILAGVATLFLTIGGLRYLTVRCPRFSGKHSPGAVVAWLQ